MKINFCATCSFEGKWDGCLSLVGCLPRLSFSFATYVNLIVSLSSYVYEFQEITISHSDAIVQDRENYEFNVDAKNLKIDIVSNS